MRRNPTQTAKKLALVAVAMFGFGYALVPLYNVFCDIAGINGKTGEISQADAKAEKVDLDRIVTVEFDTNVNTSLPWKFRAKDFDMKVHPGEIATAVFIAENESGRSITGRAIPSVAPSQASLFFNKTECFCFTQQVLAPHEKKEMIVRFVVDSDLPKDISTMTLSYTFFEALKSDEVTVTDVNSSEALKSKG